MFVSTCAVSCLVCVFLLFSASTCADFHLPILYGRLQDSHAHGTYVRANSAPVPIQSTSQKGYKPPNITNSAFLFVGSTVHMEEHHIPKACFMPDMSPALPCFMDPLSKTSSPTTFSALEPSLILLRLKLCFWARLGGNFILRSKLIRRNRA